MTGLRRGRSAAAIIVIAKRPVPGLVKTRLCPPLRPDQAARLAGAALADTLQTVCATPARTRTLVFDGDPTGWLPSNWRLVAQRGGGLDRRLADAFDAVPAPALLIGMDTPQVRPDQLTAFDHRRFDACLGLALDGGFWAIGFARPGLARDAILGIPMSTDRTGAAQLDRMRSLGLRVQLLDELIDVDTVDSAHAVALTTPGSRFAAALARELVVESHTPVRDGAR